MAPLGIDLLTAPSENTSGVGGITLIHFHDVGIEIPNLVQLSAYVGFSAGMDQLGFGLLGHRGFLDQFKLSLHLNHFEIETF
jgi:hypothetical protein